MVPSDEHFACRMDAGLEMARQQSSERKMVDYFRVEAVRTGGLECAENLPISHDSRVYTHKNGVVDLENLTVICRSLG